MWVRARRSAGKITVRNRSASRPGQFSGVRLSARYHGGPNCRLLVWFGFLGNSPHMD